MKTSQATRLGANQAIAPQLQQGLSFLVTPLLELRSVISNELQNNPLLEELPPDDTAQQLDVELNGKTFPDYSDPAEPPTENVLGGEIFKVSEEMADFFFDNLTREVSLQEHLIAQVHMMNVQNPTDLAAFYDIIGDIDENGYYNGPVDIPSTLLRYIQDNFTPRGVGATSTQQCIALQLNPNQLAWEIVTEYWSELLTKKYDRIKIDLSLSDQQFESALSIISACSPYPGRAFDSSPVVEVLPEVFIDDSLNVTLNREDTPRLRTSAHYKQLLTNPTTPADAKAWIKEKAIAAKHLLRNLSERSSTLLKVAKYIVEKQGKYFTDGPVSMTPMTMAEVAEALGYHETTISRAVANKWMQTPRGLMPMRFFFTAGTSWENPDVSNAAIKERIQRLVAGEDPNNRYNDDDIVRELKKYGVTIARRTVAKYRLELRILPYHIRGK